MIFMILPSVSEHVPLFNYHHVASCLVFPLASRAILEPCLEPASSQNEGAQRADLTSNIQL